MLKTLQRHPHSGPFHIARWPLLTGFWLLATALVIQHVTVSYTAASYGLSSLLTGLFQVAVVAVAAAVICRLRTALVTLPLVALWYYYLPQTLLVWLTTRALSQLSPFAQGLSLLVLALCSLCVGVTALQLYRHAAATLAVPTPKRKLIGIIGLSSGLSLLQMLMAY
jgi:hypothetical protein